ncbi:MAG: hypothetical protein H0W02_10290 [Ktedonobacteraceae bacterium]|nr:hypothetical protein [Ktedonobacteraceae bacterium]
MTQSSRDRTLIGSEAALPAALSSALFVGSEEALAGSQPAIEPSPDDALLFWSNKRPVVVPRGKAHANAAVDYSGFLIPTDQNPWLDEAMAAAGFQTIVIAHSDGEREHWRLDQAHLFPLIAGLQSAAQMSKTTERYGVAYGWSSYQDKMSGATKSMSVLRFRCLLPALLGVGYLEPLKFSISGTMTGDVLNSLTRQFAVLKAVNRLRGEHGLPAMSLPFWAFSLTFAPGAPSKRGQATVTPPVVQVPPVIDAGYLASHRVLDDWIALIEEAVAESVPWSVAESQRIAAGNGHTDEVTPVPASSEEDLAHPF